MAEDFLDFDCFSSQRHVWLQSVTSSTDRDSPVQVLKSFSPILCSLQLSSLLVDQIDAVKSQHELISTYKPLHNFLGLPKGLKTRQTKEHKVHLPNYLHQFKWHLNYTRPIILPSISFAGVATGRHKTDKCLTVPE